MKELGILALILAATVIIYKISALLALGRRHPQEALPGTGASGTAAGQNTLSHRCYQAYAKLEEEKRSCQALAEAFTGQTGILNRIQLLLGYERQVKSNAAAAGSGGSKQQGRSYLLQQLETIHEELHRLDVKNAAPSMTEAQYIHNLQIEEKQDEELGHLLDSLTAQRARLERDEEHTFYRNLKHMLLALPWEELLAGDMQAADGQRSFPEELKNVCESLTLGLTRSGLAYVWYEQASEKEQETCFLALPNAQEYPCLVRAKDRTLIAFGRVKQQEAARQQNAG